MEKVKQTPVDLFVMVPKETRKGRRITLVKCDRVEKLRGIAPTKEILQTHFEAERIRMKIHEQNEKSKYVPQPLFLEIEPELFQEIIEQAQAIDRDAPSDFIALTLGNKFPCCIIKQQEPNVESQKSNDND